VAIWLPIEISRAAGIKPPASLAGDDLAEGLQEMQTLLVGLSAAGGRWSLPGVNSEGRAFPDQAVDEDEKPG